MFLMLNKKRPLRRATLSASALLGAFAVSAVALSGVFGPNQALAEDSPYYPATSNDSLNETLPVRERPRPEYDPLGVLAGPYIFYPSLEVGVEYDSNIFSTPNATDDGAFVVSPTLIAKSQFTRHMLNFEAGLDHRFYFENSSEDRTDAYARLDGRVDVRSDLSIATEAGAAYLHEDRSSSSIPGAAAEPPAYKLYDANAVVTKIFNRLRLASGAAIEYYDYDDVDAIGGGKIDQDFRDGLIYRIISDATYQFSPGYSAFLRSEANWRHFEDTPTTNRDSQGFNILAGLEMDLTRIVRGRVGAGYFWQDYDAANLRTIDGWSYLIGLEWMPTPLFTVNLLGESKVAETTIVGASGRVDRSLALVVDYEFRRNVIISPYAKYTHQSFEGSTREDDLFEVGVDVDYLINRHLSASFEYDYENRSSDVAAVDFDSHRVGVFMKVQY
jgi:hypothetical protein